MNVSDILRKNAELLAANPYPGRGIVIGRSPDGQSLVLITWIMGRGTNSRNRVYLYDARSGRVYTEAADPSKMEDPSLIIYDAMEQSDDGYVHVASNGKQTEIVDVDPKYMLSEILCDRDYSFEPDAPNFTPRITGRADILDETDFLTEICLLKRSPFSGACDVQNFMYRDIAPGMGYCVTTYQGDGNPLPSFQGEPYLLPFVGDDPESIAAGLWTCLNLENRISIAVKAVHLQTQRSSVHIINRFKQVA
jgi:IMP cyclohydrolase